AGVHEAREKKEAQGGQADRSAGYNPAGKGKTRRVRGEHHQRSDDESGDTANSERAKGTDVDLRDHESDAEKQQRSTGIVDRYKGERVERDKKANCAD